MKNVIVISLTVIAGLVAEGCVKDTENWIMFAACIAWMTLVAVANITKKKRVPNHRPKCDTLSNEVKKPQLYDIKKGA